MTNQSQSTQSNGVIKYFVKVKIQQKVDVTIKKYYAREI